MAKIASVKWKQLAVFATLVVVILVFFLFKEIRKVDDLGPGDPSKAHWEKIGVTPSGSDLYVDKDFHRPPGEVAEVRWLESFPKLQTVFLGPDVVHYQSEVGITAFLCHADGGALEAQKAGANYQDVLGQGTLVYSREFLLTWQLSTGGLLKAYVCKD
jgi:hypothetical protein